MPRAAPWQAPELQPAAMKTGITSSLKLIAGSTFVIAGPRRQIVAEFCQGYGYAQFYAPADQAFACPEPMTAPTNALLAGGPELIVASPGESYRAAFRISVEELLGDRAHN